MSCFSLIFQIASVSFAATVPKRPSIETQNVIRERIAAGVEAQIRFDILQRDEKNLRKILTDRGVGDADDPIFLQRWDRTLKDLKEADFERQSHFAAALEMTAEAYGLRPEGHAEVKNGPMAGKVATWSAIYFDDGPHFRKVVGPNGSHYLGLEGPNAAIDDFAEMAKTMDDGVIGVRLEAFKTALATNNPGFLGSVLYRETVQYERLVKDGWHSKEIIKKEAFDQESRWAGVFGLDSGQIQRVKEKRALWREKAAKAKANPFLYQHPFTSFAEERTNKVGFDAAEKLKEQAFSERTALKVRLEAWKKEVADKENLRSLQIAADIACSRGYAFQPDLDLLERRPDRSIYCTMGWINAEDPCSKRAYLEIEGAFCKGASPSAERVNKTIQNYQPRPGNPGPPAPGEARVPFDGPWQLAGLASKACASPGSLSQSDIDAVRWFPDPAMGFVDGPKRDLSGCSLELYETMLGFSRTWARGARLSAQWVNWEAGRLDAKYRSPAPPVDVPFPEGNDHEDRRGRQADRCYDEPGVGRVCPVK